MIEIRSATLDDAAGLNAVYNPVIRESVATFEIEEHDDIVRRSWIADRLGNPRHPIFVGVAPDGEILGFANASRFDERRGYDLSVKVSVFLAPAARGAGLGGRLYSALMPVLAAAGVHRAYAGIVPPNPASEALHIRFGFRHVATLDEVGRKFDRFLSVMWFEKRF